MFQQLLLAIDDSSASEVAVVFAGAFAKRTGATVHVFHVNEYLVSGRGLTLHSRDEVTALVTDAVLELRASGVQAGGSAVVSSYRYRQVARCIARAALERQADAIILGSHRHGRFHRLLSSGVRERTIRLSPLPVLTAPAPLEISGRRHSAFDDVILEQMEREAIFAPH
jgi:nucleotide-binding universal stress UspA family protein